LPISDYRLKKLEARSSKLEGKKKDITLDLRELITNKLMNQLTTKLLND